MGKITEGLDSYLADPSHHEQFMTFTNGGNFTAEHWQAVKDLLGEAHTGGKIMGGAFIQGDIHRPVRRAEALVERRLTEFEQRRLGDLGLKAQYGELPIEI